MMVVIQRPSANGRDGNHVPTYYLFRLTQIQLSAFAEARIAEGLHRVTETLSNRHEQAVMRLLLKLERTAGLEA